MNHANALGLGILVIGVAASCGGANDTDNIDAGRAPAGSATPGFGDVVPREASAPDAKSAAPNLIANGDFEMGNVLFASDYAYATTNSNEGQYTVGGNGQLFNSLFVTAGNHTAGKSLMFIGNGKATPDRVWFSSSSVSTLPNTQYYFEAWVMNLCCASGVGDGIHPVAPSVLSFYANDVLLGTRTSAKLGVWEGLTTTWNSGAATSVTLKLVNANTEFTGNDFAVDDIYLGTETSIPPPK